ncbi:thioredoxin-dependent peroxiredoxin [Thermostichus sp. MS-CIW-23]
MAVKEVGRVWRWLNLMRLVVGLLVGFGMTQPAWAQWGTTPLPPIGSPAPEFALPDQSGQIRRLADFRGEWVVLYFYPRDFTSGCTIEARRFQQDLPKFRAMGAQVVGVSADSVDSHRRFCSAEGLQFPLLSDPDGTVSRAYGSWMGDVALRNTFLIDPEGILREIDPIVNPSRHSAEVLAQLQRLVGS